MTDLSADLVMHPFVRVTPLKGVRAEDARPARPALPAAARAIVAYLRFRRDHKHAKSPLLWLGLRNAGPMDG
jgi:hypothetical protein